MNVLAFFLLTGLFGLPTYSGSRALLLPPSSTASVPTVACSFVVNGGRFVNQRLTIASPPDVGQRPGAANAYWCRRPSVGTELDAKSEKPLGFLLHVPAAGRGQTGTFPLFAGAVINNGGTLPDINLHKGTVTITAAAKNSMRLGAENLAKSSAVEKLLTVKLASYFKYPL